GTRPVRTRGRSLMRECGGGPGRWSHDPGPPPVQVPGRGRYGREAAVSCANAAAALAAGATTRDLPRSRSRVLAVWSRSAPGVALRAGLGGLFDELVGLVEALAAARHERRAQALGDRLLRDHALGDVPAGRQLEHHVEERRLDDRPQSAGARLAV